MNDLISRETAIEAIVNTVSKVDDNKTLNDKYDGAAFRQLEIIDIIKDLPPAQQWIPVEERLPSKEERKEWIDKNLGGIGYLYPCLVTRYSSINPDRTKNNPYVAKHYFDGEDFLNADEEVRNEYVIAWLPLPEPYNQTQSNDSKALDALWKGKSS